MILVYFFIDTSSAYIYTLSLHDALPIFKARIAEKELFLKDQITRAQRAGNTEEAESLQKQLTIEIRRLQEDAERSEEHTSELQSLTNLVCRLLLEKKKQRYT